MNDAHKFPIHCPLVYVAYINIYPRAVRGGDYHCVYKTNLDLEGSLVAQMVSKQVGSGLETYLLTFGAHKYPLWTILGSFLVHFGPILAPFLGRFWTKMDQKWGVQGPKSGPRGSKMGPKWPKNDQELCRNTLNHFYSWPTWTPRWAIFGHFCTPPPLGLAGAHGPRP